MRDVGRLAAACLVLSLVAALGGAPAARAATEGAEAAAFAAPEPRPAARAQSDDTSWGVLFRGGYFGLPDAVADRLFRQHPKLAGHTYGAELRYHGDGGGRGVSSIGFAVESASVDGEGIWQPEKEDRPAAFGGKVEMLCFSVTGYWSMFPTWYVHPYVGFGLGVARLEGEYRDDEAVTTLDTWMPAVHVPVGLAFEFGPTLQFSLEARVLNGIAVGGALQARF